jgi:peptidoglycan/LPS O-acetylase OafA/YrhL
MTANDTKKVNDFIRIFVILGKTNDQPVLETSRTYVLSCIMPASENIKYIPAIDHLRAYAIILVLAFHSIRSILHESQVNWPLASNPLMAVVHEGHTGVALFIVLSGFIFTYGSAGKRINYLQFLRNRVLRIYPLMMTITIIGISAYPEKFKMSGFICILLPFQNTNEALQLGNYTTIFWTIGVECQFYLIFPILHQMLVERGFVVLLFALAFTITARLSALLQGGNPLQCCYFSILGRMDQFVIGMMVAVVVRNFSVEDRRLRWGVPIGGAGLLAGLFAINHLHNYVVLSPWMFIWSPIEALLWGIFIAGYLAFLYGTENIYTRSVAKIGTISYSMYLTHMVVISIFIQHSFTFVLPYSRYLGPLLSVLIIILPATIIISSLCYHVIEKPFLELRQLYLEPITIENTGHKILANGV